MAEYRLIWRVQEEDWTNEQCLKELLETLAKEGQAVDEFNLFIGEETRHAHLPICDVKRKCEQFKKAAAMIRSYGKRVGINPWPSFGCYDDPLRIGHERRDMPFRPMVGMDGTSINRVACPVSSEFLAYTKEKFKIFAETRPDFIWIEDDWRFTHIGIPYPCFCSACVAGFENGRFESREQLVHELNKQENRYLRHKWSEYTATRLATCCAAARAGVDEVNPNIEMKFMSVGSTHTTYGGDYIEKCMDAIRSTGGRPGHGFYTDETPREMFVKAMNVSRQVLRYSKESLCDVQYEEESFPRAQLNKATVTRLLEAGLSIWSGCTGFLFNRLRATGGDRHFGYLNTVKKRWEAARPFFHRYFTFAKDIPQVGLWIADHPFLMAGMDVEHGWFDEFNEKYNVSRVLDEWPERGTVVSADAEHAYGTVLQGRIINSFSDEEIKTIFEKPVFMDGEALKVLEKRGFAKLAGVHTGRKYGECYEKLTAACPNGPFAGERFALFGTNYELLVDNENVEILSRYIDPYGVDLGACVTRFGNVTVFGSDPYRFVGTVGKVYQMNTLFKEAGAPVIVESKDPHDVKRLSAWVRSDGKKYAILLINPSLDGAHDMQVVITGKATKVAAFSIDMPEQEVTAEYENNTTKIPVPDMGAWEMLLLLVE